jgi:two-component system sensor histidine kinase MtrB
VGACFRLTLPLEPGEEVRSSPLPLEVHPGSAVPAVEDAPVVPELPQHLVSSGAGDTGDTGDTGDSGAFDVSDHVDAEEAAEAFEAMGPMNVVDAFGGFEGFTEEEVRKALEEAADMDEYHPTDVGADVHVDDYDTAYDPDDDNREDRDE